MVITDGLNQMERKEFINKVAPMAIQSQKDFGVPASITIAQAILESGNGNSKLARDAKNYFGIRANKGYTGTVYNINTGEYDKAGNYYIDKKAAFRSYPTIQASFDDHSDFLLKNKRYDSLFDLELNDYKGWATGLQRAGYSTAPTYAQTIIGLINNHDLTKYDKQALQSNTIANTATRNLRRFKTGLLIFGSFALLGGTAIYLNNKKPKK